MLLRDSGFAPVVHDGGLDVVTAGGSVVDNESIQANLIPANYFPHHLVFAGGVLNRGGRGGYNLGGILIEGRV